MANTTIPVELSSTPGIVDNSNATAIIIDSSENVGIGAISPAEKLHVAGAIATTSGITGHGANRATFSQEGAGGAYIQSYGANTSTMGAFVFRQASSDFSVTNSAMTIDSSGNVSTSGAVLAGASVNNFSPNQLVTGENTDGQAGLNIQTSATGSGYVLFGDGAGAGAYMGQIRYSHSDDSMNFHTVTTTRLSIDSSGFLNIASGPKTGRINMQPNPSNNHFFEFYNTSDVKCGEINTATGTQTNYVTSSDYRLKEDDQPMTGATERVKALRPINFAWKVDGSRVDGFLAHEAQEVVPECVTGTKDAMMDEEYEVTPAVEEVRDEDGNVTTEAVAAVMGTRSVPDYQGIDQSKLVPLLTAALQEAITKIEDLTTRLETLENA